MVAQSLDLMIHKQLCLIEEHQASAVWCCVEGCSRHQQPLLEDALLLLTK